MPLQLFRDRVRKRADEVLSSFRVLEDLEVGVEHFICFAYRHGERKPISRGGYSLCGHIVHREKLVHD